MTPDELRDAGELLCGLNWRCALARQIGSPRPGSSKSIDPSLVGKWAQGERPIPDWVPEALAGLLQAQADLYPERIRTVTDHAQRCANLAARLLQSLDAGGLQTNENRENNVIQG